MAAESPQNALQTKKQDFVRREIWNAAIDLFIESGFDEVTVDQIAMRSGVSRRTFFRYFASKEDVMASTVRNFGISLTDAILTIDRKVGGLQTAKIAVLKALPSDLKSAEKITQIAGQSPAARMAQFLEVPMFEQELAKAFATQAGRRGRANLKDRILASVALSATSMTVEIWVAQPKRLVADIVEEVFAALKQAFTE